MTETRVYQSWVESTAPKQATGQVTAKSGIVAGKKALNMLHIQLGAAGFDQVNVKIIIKLIFEILNKCYFIPEYKLIEI